MDVRSRLSLIGVAAVLAAASCESPPPPRSSALGPQETAAPKRVTAAIKSDPPLLIQRINPTPIGFAGAGELEELVAVGLSGDDSQGGLQPKLAEAVPTLENGLWKLFPDGAMETTWRVRTNARWHDRAPFTAEDLLFTARVDQDRDLPISRNLAYGFIERIQAPEPGTLTVRWSQPFIEADLLFSNSPLPRHLLEQTYLDDKTALAQLPYFTREFVGTGPYRVRDWVGGSHVVLLAFDDYVLGRPKIDEIEVKFISDSTTLAANILAGAVELTLGRNLSLDQAIQIQDQWRDGKAEIGFKNWIMIYPQFINSSPAVVADLRFRRALMHAMDRQEMADSLVMGLASVGHSLLNPNQAQYQDVESRIIRYEYDPRKAAMMIESLGYVRGADGFRDATARKLAVEIRTSKGDDLQEKSMFASADYWQRVGVGVDPVVVPPERSRDAEYRQTFPAFDLKRQPNDVDAFKRMHSSQTPLPETRFVGTNFSRYVNSELDALIDRYFATIPKEDRVQVVGQIAQHIAEQLNLMGLFYQAEPSMIANRLQNIVVKKVGGSTHMGNAHEWDIR